MKLKKLRYLLELIIILPFYWLAKLLPITISSYIFGKLAQGIGYFLHDLNNIADINLQRCMPHLLLKERKKIITDMWNNLGRIIGEMPHWATLDKYQVQQYIKVIDHTNGDIYNNPGSIMVSAHYGNWEIATRMFCELNLPMQLVYRPANNPYVDAMILKNRTMPNIGYIKKGVAGMRSIVKGIIDKKNIGMLVDQKTNDGIEVLFFGHLAKTTSAPANLALKYGVKIYLCRYQRIKSCHYQFDLYALPIENGKEALQITEEINQHIQKWIEEAPEQWMWVHKRWDKKLYK